MSRRLKLRMISAATMLITASSIFAANPASAATQWGSYQWSSAPQNLLVYKNLVTSATGTNWSTFVDRAAGGWTRAPVSITTITETQGVDRRKCPAQTGTVEVCNNTYGQNGWLGIAQIWTSGNFIVRGTVKLNDTYFNMAAYSSSGWKNLVTCQEVGHTIGLSHDDTTFGNTNFGTCMDYTSYPDNPGQYFDFTAGLRPTTDNWSPNGNDYALLSCMYASPGVGCATKTSFGNPPRVAASVPTGGGPTLHSGPTDFGIRIPGQVPASEVDPGNTPAEWGKVVALTHDGRGRVYERTVGEGRKIITEVFWAPQ